MDAELVKKCKDLIVKGKLEMVLSLFSQTEVSARYKDQILQLQARLVDLRNEERAGTISTEESIRLKNQLRRDIIKQLEILQGGDRFEPSQKPGRRKHWLLIVAAVLVLTFLSLFYFLNREHTADLSFISIQGDSSLVTFQRELLSGDFYSFLQSKAPFNQFDELFTFNSMVEHTDVAFDVTLLNESGKPIILKKAGIEVISVAQFNFPAFANVRSFKVENTSRFDIEMPNLIEEVLSVPNHTINDHVIRVLSESGFTSRSVNKLRKGDEWFSEYRKDYEASRKEFQEKTGTSFVPNFHESMLFINYLKTNLEEEENGKKALKGKFMDILMSAVKVKELNKEITNSIPDPVYLEEQAPFRYSLVLKEYSQNIPNVAIIRLILDTNRGVAKSEPILVYLSTIR